MTPRHAVAVLTRFDLRFTLQSARGVLTLAFFGIFWAWALKQLGGGAAHVMTTPEAGMIGEYILDEDVMRLFRIESPTMTAFLVMALWATPAFATLAGCDQTATDLASKHLRFLIPRTGRGSIFLARFLAASLFMAALQVLITAIAITIALAVDSTSGGAVVSFGLRVALTLIAYSTAFIALLAAVAAFLPSAPGVALLVLGAYAILALVASTMKSRYPWAEWVLCVTPGGFKKFLVSDETGPLLGAFGALAGVTAAYLALGWKIFRERDA